MTPRYKRALPAVKRVLRKPADPDLVCGCHAVLDRPKVGRPPERCSDCRKEHRRKYQRYWQQKKRQRQCETRYWSRVTICNCEEKR